MPKLARVLFTESSPNIGGQELQLLEQARGLAGRGVQTRLLCPETSRIAELAVRYRVPVTAVPFRNSVHPRSVLGVRRVLADWRPDAVLCHSGHDADVSALAARLVGRPRPRLVRMRTYQHGSPHAWTYNRLFDRTLVPSEEMRARLLANPRVGAERIAVLRPGIAFAELDARAALPLDAALEQALSRFPPRRLTHAAMLRGEKGHLFMLEVLARLRKSVPELCYVIAGEGELKERIDQQVKLLGLQANVCFAGLVRELPPLYVRSELVVMPSFYEPLGMSQIEALGLGVPVVASRVGGIPETVHERRTGLLAAPGDMEAWTEALSWALAHRAEMRAMAQAGRADVRQRFELAKVLDELAGHLV
ncbi:MAG TPA: glycosyltransferase family 4 protein [Burkholderiales bacterium]|nr:glycosyltransferase family 4 protein [Burkholderiales bacterium]